MASATDRVLTAQEAAAVIYNTNRPTDEQVNRVRAHLSRGVLARGGRGPWTTTTESVAKYMASCSMAKKAHDGKVAAGDELLSRLDRAKSEARARRVAPDAGMPLWYRELMRDYFLALIRRRTVAAGRSGMFGRSVLAGQLLVLLLMAGGIALGFKLTLGKAPPEHAAVERWLSENVGRYAIVEWLPVDEHDLGAGTAVRLKYTYYTPNRKSILTDRVFLVEGDQVMKVASTD